VYYDQYRSTNRVDMASDIGTLDARMGGEGDWVGTQLTYRFPVAQFGYLTVGSEANWDLRTEMYAYYAAPVHQDVLSIDPVNRSAAVFLQDEWALSPHWKAYLGGRLDASRYHDLALTPRIGLIYQPSESTAWKLLYGSAFRDASAYEQFYADGVTQEANPALNPERMQTFEGVLEKQLRKKVEVSANVYYYRLNDLITAVWLDGTLQQYRNAASMHSTGLELESKAEIGARVKLDASLALQGSGYGTATVGELNSPARVGKLLMDAQLFRGHLSMSGALQYMSERRAFGVGSVPDVYLVNVSFDVRRLPNDLELQFGVRNLLNRRYWDPVNVSEGMDRLEQDGRCFFVRLSWSPKPEAKSKSASGMRNGGRE
jgi:iron complex outermembrane receptor protein